jgi:hypothetical protein
MAGLFERGEVLRRTLLVDGVALDRVDNDHGIQVVQHSRSSRGGFLARGVQFSVPFGVLRQASLVFGTQFFRRPPWEATGALLGGDLLDHACQAALWSNRRGDTNRDSHGAGREPWLVR